MLLVLLRTINLGVDAVARFPAVTSEWWQRGGAALNRYPRQSLAGKSFGSHSAYSSSMANYARTSIGSRNLSRTPHPNFFACRALVQ